MTPIQQLMLGVGAKEKTYLDDVFSTFLYEGNSTGSSSQSINNGIDLSGEGGMTWIKYRDGTYGHSLFDTVRGGTKRLSTNGSSAQNTWTNAITSFNNNGFTLGSEAQVNYDDLAYASWTFRKAPGFFDVISWSADSGNNTKTLNHNLGSVPGLIVFKKYDFDWSWVVWHRDMDANNGIYLNSNAVEFTNADMSVSNVTSTQFTVGGDHNGGSGNYIAYVFAGGESAAATARSGDFVSSNSDYLKVPTHTDFNLGSNDFTIECWVRSAQAHSGYKTLLGQYDNTYAQMIRYNSSDIGSGWSWFGGSGKTCFGQAINDDHWHHIAVVRHGNVVTTYTDGKKNNTLAYTGSVTSSTEDFYFGKRGGSGELFNGKISNFRLVNGTAVYTSSFRPPTEPLTNITNTKLLCLQDSTLTTATVSPTTIASTAMPDASTDSPFDDPAAFTFGDSNEGIIKCGSYVGNGSSPGPEIYLGWEPQWILFKNTDTTNDWRMFDSMRGIVTGGNDERFNANTTAAEVVTNNKLELTSTGFICNESSPDLNGDGNKIIYIAIRRPDGYVGKPASVGTDVFNVTAADTTLPAFNANFAVDLAIYRRKSSNGGWTTSTRLNAHKYLRTNTSGDESDLDISWFAYNDGFSASDGFSTDRIGWLWKRHAGLDVITYKSDGVAGRQIPHSLGRVPEMLWIKDREHTRSWAVYHKGLNGGTNPEDYWLTLDTTDSEVSNTSIWYSTAPTATHISLGSSHPVNTSLIHDMICIAFASVPGVSALGYYDGHASNNINLTSQLDFSPRFFMCKSTTDTTGWLVVDKTRDTNMGKRLFFNSSAVETSYDAVWAMSKYLEPNKTGLSVDGEKYIFYAHA